MKFKTQKELYPQVKFGNKPIEPISDNNVINITLEDIN